MNFSTTYCNVHDLLGRQQGPGVRRIPTIPYSYNIITGKEKSLLLINAVSYFQDKGLNSQKLQLFLFPIFIKIWYRLKELSWCLWQQLLKLKILSLPCGVSLFLLPQFDVSGDLLLNKGKAAWNLLVYLLYLPWVTKTEFLLSISIQYQPNKWWEYRKISIWR